LAPAVSVLTVCETPPIDNVVRASCELPCTESVSDNAPPVPTAAVAIPWNVVLTCARKSLIDVVARGFIIRVADRISVMVDAAV